MTGVIPARTTTLITLSTLTAPTTLTTMMPTTLTSLITNTHTTTLTMERTVLTTVITTYTTTFTKTPEFSRGRLEVGQYHEIEIRTLGSPDIFTLRLTVWNRGGAVVAFRYINITGPGVNITNYTDGLHFYLGPGEGWVAPEPPWNSFYYYGPGDSMAPVPEKIWPINPVVNATYHVLLAYTDVYHLDETYLLELDLVAT